MFWKSISVFGAVSVAGVLGEGCTGAVSLLPTAGQSDGLFTYGRAPAPTTAPTYDVNFGELVKRQDVGTTVCGLISSNTALSYTCPGTSVCGFNTQDRNHFGCCSSYLGSGTVTGCYLPTVCYDSAVAKTMSCALSDRPCIWSSLYCTSSARPYCGKYMEAGLTGYNCFASPSMTVNLVEYTGSASGSISGSSKVASTTSNGSASTTPATSVTSSANPATEKIPFSQQQATVGGTDTPLTKTSSGLAVGSIQAGELWYGFLMSIALLVL